MKDLRIWWRWLMLVSFAAFMVAGPVAAGQRRCPVCNQFFDDSIEICPNDGTDLKLLGEKVEPAGAPEPETSDSAEKSAETSPDNGETNNEERKYIRHDRGGKRKRTAPQEDEDAAGSGRSDRQRRLRDERTGVAQVKKKETPVDKNAVKDAALREEYRANKEKAIQEALAKKKTEAKPDPELERQKALWKQTAPYMSIGGRFSWMGEADKPGLVMGTEIDLNLLRTNVRVGLSSFIGVRHVSRNELIFLENVSIGVQKPWRFSPYLSGHIGIGTIISQRFGEDITNLVRAVGIDAGIDCRLNNAFVVTPSVGYVRYAIRDVAWDSLTLKISLGF
ncbi:MAG: hypothetical protein JXX29_18245 [Deltaproteobacteria bacterium]|nr:hypothetical protein [Deltaproteobacteria bacterium]MBN2673626.1 hypothetical protein [Deltaproteobacteria bacterium]